MTETVHILCIYTYVYVFVYVYIYIYIQNDTWLHVYLPIHPDPEATSCVFWFLLVVVGQPSCLSIYVSISI